MTHETPAPSQEQALLRAKPLVQPIVAPELENQKCPEGFAVVVLARLMLGDAAGDDLGVEKALPF